MQLNNTHYVFFLGEIKSQSQIEAMSGVYQVTEIEGKGLLCIATMEIEKGSLILNENPQMSAETEEMWSAKWIESLLKSFNKMSKADQLEYMTNKNNCSWILDMNSNLKSRIGKMEKDSEKAKEICCIYVSYRMNDGFRIKTSGFKHSCQPNAVKVQKSIGLFEVRAISNIKTGQEINLNLSIDPFYGFKNKIDRQEILLNAPPFVICYCDLCESDVDIDANAFKALILEAEELANSRRSLENVREQVKCYKKMYNVGKTQKIQYYFLYYNVLKLAFNTAKFGWLMFQAADLKMEAKSLIITMKNFGKFLGDDATLKSKETIF